MIASPAFAVRFRPSSSVLEREDETCVRFIFQDLKILAS